MRRTVGFVIGACAALTLAGVAGVTTYVEHDEPRVVGTWHEAPGVAPTPVAAVTPELESGRQRVGTLKKVNSIVGYVGAPQRRTFRYPGASYVKLHVSRMLMLPGDYVTVSDGSGTESHRYDAPALGAAGALLKQRTTNWWAMSVTGDTAVLELHRAAGGPAGAALSGLGVTVDKVARGWTPREMTRAAEPAAPAGRSGPTGRSGREESVCGSDESVDAICYRTSDPVAYTRSKAIARLLINGTELCTGWRVGARNRMLTNNHCFDNSDDAYQTEVWFNYACAKCGGRTVLKPTKVWGDRVVVTNRPYDFTLFTVEHFEAIKKFGNLTLDTRRPNRTQELYIPQHPAGEPMRISGARGERAGTCAVVDNAYDGYAKDSDVSYYCDTEGGSSGSPVLSRYTDKVVALHHFGGCPNSGVRADVLHNKIKTWI